MIFYSLNAQGQHQHLIKSYFSDSFPSLDFETEFAQINIFMDSLDTVSVNETLAYGSGGAE